MEKSRGEITLALFNWHKGLIPTTRVGWLTSEARSHPFEKSNLLGRCSLKGIISGAFPGMALLGGKNIAKPVALVGVGLLKQFDKSEAEVVTERRREMTAVIKIHIANVVIEGTVGGVVARSKDAMLDGVAVVPLVPGQVVQLYEQALGPAFARLAAASGIVIALLQLSPLRRHKALKQVLPANGRLGLHRGRHPGIIKGNFRQLGLAPTREVRKNGLLKGRQSIGI